MTCFVFDNSPLSHFARARHLAALESITAGSDRVVTRAVLDELARGAAGHVELEAIEELDWLRCVRVDALTELQAFTAYAARVGSGERDIGEASTLGWAEVHGAIAILDERAGTRHARERGLEVHGTLWLVARGYRTGVLTVGESKGLVDALHNTEMWFPCDGETFFEWAQREGLL